MIAFEPSTRTVRRGLLEGVARQRPEEVEAMVTALRGRGKSWTEIDAWLGPRASCPRRLVPLRERVALFASLET